MARGDPLRILGRGVAAGIRWRVASGQGTDPARISEGDSGRQFVEGAVFVADKQVRSELVWRSAHHGSGFRTVHRQSGKAGMPIALGEKRGFLIFGIVMLGLMTLAAWLNSDNKDKEEGSPSSYSVQRNGAKAAFL